MIILARMLIISEYPNNKKTFIQFTSITALFANYKRMGLCPTQNKDKSVILTVSFHCVDLTGGFCDAGVEI